MKKLRRSRFAKFISGVLIIILSAVIVANIVGTILLMEENLYYADKQHIQQKVYSYMYNYTASDLLKYLSLCENMYANNDNYQNYHKSEVDLFRSKYSTEQSNINFIVSDEYDNILLSNNNSLPTDYFTFSSVFASDTEEYFRINFDEYDNISVIETGITEIIDTTAYFDNNTQIDDESDSETVFIDEDNSIISDKNNVPTIVSDSDYYLSEFSVTNIYSGNKTTVLYYYQDLINESILSFCKEEVKDLSFDIDRIKFYQDDYKTDDNGEIYYNKRFSDENEPEKSFTTTLTSGEKTANITYRYKGSFLMQEFTNRLAYSTLIINNNTLRDFSFDYIQTGRIQLNVSVHVPMTCHTDDIWKVAEKSVEAAVFYRDNILILTIIDILLYIFSFAFLFYSAGYIPGKDTPVARGLHAIPVDILTPILVLVCVGLFALFCTEEPFFVVASIIGFAVCAVSFVYTLTVRIKAHTLIKSSIIYKLMRLVKHVIKTISESGSIFLKIIIFITIFLVIAIFESIFIIFLGGSSDSIFSGIFILVLRLIEIPIILLILTALLSLHNAAKRISSGDIDYRIKNEFLIGPFKKHADYLNSINDTVNNAVEERVRSESLKTELITNVSHDLKTPLTSIVNYIDLLKKEDISNPDAEEYIKVIDRQSQRLKKLTIDIIEASKAATGNIEIHNENLNLNVILQQTVGEYIERFQERELYLIPNIPDKNILISADGRLLWRVLDNIMNNIYKYSMSGTRVYMDVSCSGSYVFISLRNISKEKLNISPDDLTERFVRGDSSRNTDGSGLGLSIAKSLTEAMNGSFDISIDGDLFKVCISFPENEI